MSSGSYTILISLITALGGFLMGFDASVISGVVGFVRDEYQLTELEVGWAVASLTLTSTAAMLAAGPLSDRLGRRPVLQIAAILFFLSALASAFAPDYLTLVLARMLGGFGVGAALIVAPMYIAEIAPTERRGRLVSLNQLNIVIGISAAYFSNYLMLQWSQTPDSFVADGSVWRWMLGAEMLPAVLYVLALNLVPESPRWLLMKNRPEEAQRILARAQGEARATAEIAQINQSIDQSQKEKRSGFKDLLHPSMRLVMLVGISVAVLQQITGINAVFFYAPMIFEQTAAGADASFLQAVLVGLVNLVFTVMAILLIDRIGRRPLLQFGVAGIAVFMLLLSYSFSEATYKLDREDLPKNLNPQLVDQIAGVQFDDERNFKAAIRALAEQNRLAKNPETTKMETESLATEHPIIDESALFNAGVDINSNLVLLGMLGFVACFALSLGPVMWVLFSELFPNHIRGVAISFVGLVNSGVSFGVQLVFPWELAVLGSAATFLLFGLFAVLGLAIVSKIVPETRGRSLEELETLLVSAKR